MASKPTCSTCMYFVRDDSPAVIVDPETGECRRYAPTGRTQPAADDGSRIESNSIFHWPVVYDDDWCGEWAYLR